ncbi:hypothetical protein EDB85DRAFT_2155965 [Lactarius pseudohatsudake]|nr:hypothetical protein EDB85DRAFT_2155965 [Lactarius pseudohatsudake]
MRVWTRVFGRVLIVINATCSRPLRRTTDAHRSSLSPPPPIIDIHASLLTPLPIDIVTPHGDLFSDSDAHSATLALMLRTYVVLSCGVDANRLPFFLFPTGPFPFASPSSHFPPLQLPGHSDRPLSRLRPTSVSARIAAACAGTYLTALCLPGHSCTHGNTHWLGSYCDILDGSSSHEGACTRGRCVLDDVTCEEPHVAHSRTAAGQTPSLPGLALTDPGPLTNARPSGAVYTAHLQTTVVHTTRNFISPVPTTSTVQDRSGAAARPPAREALHRRGPVEVEEVLPGLRRVIVPGDQVLDNRQVRELRAPTTPLANPPERPPEVAG